jgi:hypothetical protein
MERHSREFFRHRGEKLEVRDAERIGITLLNRDSKAVYHYCLETEVDLILNDDRYRERLISEGFSRRADIVRKYG